MALVGRGNATRGAVHLRDPGGERLEGGRDGTEEEHAESEHFGSFRKTENVLVRLKVFVVASFVVAAKLWQKNFFVRDKFSKSFQEYINPQGPQENPTHYPICAISQIQILIRSLAYGGVALSHLLENSSFVF